MTRAGLVIGAALGLLNGLLIFGDIYGPLRVRFPKNVAISKAVVISLEAAFGLTCLLWFAGILLWG